MAELNREEVIKQAQESNVQFIRLWFTDVLGTLKSFAITVDELEDALDGGMGFDGSLSLGLSVISLPRGRRLSRNSTWPRRCAHWRRIRHHNALT